jgi:hypothetical protein
VLYRVIKLSWNSQESWHFAAMDVEREGDVGELEQVAWSVEHGAIIWTKKEGGMSDSDMKKMLVSVISTKVMNNIHVMEEDMNTLLGMAE